MHRVGQTILALALATALAGCTAMTSQSAGRNFDDASITASVQRKLAREQASTPTRINVTTVDRTVYLNGWVPDLMAKRRAAEIAGRVDGVDNVVNNLQTQSAADAPYRPGIYWEQDQGH